MYLFHLCLIRVTASLPRLTLFILHWIQLPPSSDADDVNWFLDKPCELPEPSQVHPRKRNNTNKTGIGIPKSHSRIHPTFPFSKLRIACLPFSSWATIGTVPDEDKNPNGLLSRPLGTSCEFRQFLLDLSPDLPIGVGVGMDIDVGFTRLYVLNQFIERFSHELARQVIFRKCPLG